MDNVQWQSKHHSLHVIENATSSSVTVFKGMYLLKVYMTLHSKIVSVVEKGNSFSSVGILHYVFLKGLLHPFLNLLRTILVIHLNVTTDSYATLSVLTCDTGVQSPKEKSVYL